MRLLLRGQELLLDEDAGVDVEIGEVALVVLEPVVFAFFEHVDRRLFAEDRGAALSCLGEGSPRARALLRVATQLYDAGAEHIDAPLMRALALLELRASGDIPHLRDRLPVGLDCGDLPAQERIEL